MRMRRSRDALAGGVCAGVADILGVDPVVTRILAVLLCLMTCGLGFIVYFVLWVAVPLAPVKPRPVDVRPFEASLETYGSQQSEEPASGRLSRAKSKKHDQKVAYAEAAESVERENAARRDLYAGVGHEPPTPPLAARAAAAAVASSYAASGAYVASSEPAASPQQSVAASPASAPHAFELVPGSVSASVAPASGARNVSKQAGIPPVVRRVLRPFLLWACFAAAFIGLLRALGLFVHGTGWWRFWPLFFALSGIAVMAVPGKPGLRMAHAVTGWFLVVAASVTLPMSLSLVRWASLGPWIASMWPALVASIAFLTVGWTRRSWPWSLAAGILFTLFCVMGLLTFAEPGSTPSIVFDLPLGRDVMFEFPFSQ